jgi:hypothetical protein
MFETEKAVLMCGCISSEDCKRLRDRHCACMLHAQVHMTALCQWRTQAYYAVYENTNIPHHSYIHTYTHVDTRPKCTAAKRSATYDMQHVVHAYLARSIIAVPKRCMLVSEWVFGFLSPLSMYACRYCGKCRLRHNGGEGGVYLHLGKCTSA